MNFRRRQEVPAAKPARAPERQLLIGVDAMEWGLVKMWMAEGKLPALRRIAEQGVQAELQSFADTVPDAVWTTLSFGVNPGKLEKYFYIHYDPKLGRLRYAHDHEIRGKQFWRHLSDAGKQVVVADVPHVPHHTIPNGSLVMNWGAHDNKHDLMVYPPTLLKEVGQRFGRHPVEDCERYNHTLRSKRRLRRDILDGVRKHGEMFRWLMQSRPWEVFLGCFSEAHSCGHHFWCHMDPAHPDYRPGDPMGFEDTIEQTYRAIDREIGKMVEQAGEHTRIMVFAPHGMGPLSHASWNLNEMLELWGFASVESRPAPAAERKGRINPWRILKMVFPARWQYAIKERLPKALQEQLLILWYAGRSRFDGRRAFAVPNNEVVGAIRISVKGRDRGGLVEPGEEYRRLRNQIREALLELTDPVTGRPVVRGVSFLHDHFQGPFVEQLPDITAFWDSRFSWRAVHSPRFGVLHLAAQDARSGSHTASSFLLACGPGIPHGAHVEGSTPLDVVASVLAAAGVQIPEHFDGRPLPMLCSQANRYEPNRERQRPEETGSRTVA
jgi:predicted AlkP superfamily phosphohydrolase/phosphomutase